MMTPEYAISISYEVLISGLALSHAQRFRVLMDSANPNPNIGTDPSNILLQTNGIDGVGGSLSLDLAISEYLGFFTALYGANFSVSSVALEYYEYGLNSIGAYVSPINLASTDPVYPSVGSSSLANQPAQQSTFTFFDSRGKVSKLTILENSLEGNNQMGLNAMPNGPRAYAEYVTGANSVVRGVDGSRLISAKLLSIGQNEKLWRNRYRA